MRRRMTAAARLFGLLVALLVCLADVQAQNYRTLRIANPLPQGSAPNGRPSGFYIYRAAPGVPWKIRVAVQGGNFPFNYELLNAPAGMTVTTGCSAIPCTDGVIAWPNPTGSTVTPTIKVTDSSGATATVEWTITIAFTGFKCVNAVSGSNSNNGLLPEDPSTTGCWQTLKKATDTAGQTDILLLYSGTYDHTGYTIDDEGGPGAITIYNKVSQWIERDGQTAIIDLEGDAHFNLGSATKYMQGFEIHSGLTFAFHMNSTNESSQGGVFEDINCHDIVGGGQGDNAGCFTTTGSEDSALRDNWIVRNSTCTANTLAVCWKGYFTTHGLFLDNTCHTIDSSCSEIKESMEDFEVRGNDIGQGVDDDSLGGNHADNEQAHGTYGVYSFNNVKYSGENGGAFAVDMCSHGNSCGAIRFHRNTIQGLIIIKTLDTDEGPITWSQNVMINGQVGNTKPNITTQGSPDFDRIVMSNNLNGNQANNYVSQSTGELQGSALTNHGPNSATPKGHLFNAFSSSALRRVPFIRRD